MPACCSSAPSSLPLSFDVPVLLLVPMNPASLSFTCACCCLEPASSVSRDSASQEHEGHLPQLSGKRASPLRWRFMPDYLFSLPSFFLSFSPSLSFFLFLPCPASPRLALPVCLPVCLPVYLAGWLALARQEGGYVARCRSSSFAPRSPHHRRRT